MTALAGLVLSLGSARVEAQPAPAASDPDAAEEREVGVVATVPRSEGADSEGRARDVVSRRQLEESLPRSAPDALRDVPGVSVQQTSHGQASPYVRGLTGQQVIHLFDGVRLNTGIYRQGPNQYFFTVDAATLDRLEVLRGSASTRWGADALGGAILAIPRERRPDGNVDGVRFEPRATSRVRSADGEWGGRAELGADLGPDTAVLVGAGYRSVGLLRSGGVVGSPIDGRRALVPRFTEELDGRPASEHRTQLGTGFDELTFDGRLVHRVTPSLRFVGAAYGYRQSDAPRTDQCPAPEAPADECLRVLEQFRTLSYVALRGDAGPLRDLDLTLSYQRHHERRQDDRPRSNVQLDWNDDVDTYGASFAASTPVAALGESAGLKARYGADVYTDRVSSSSWQSLTDLDLTLELSRGQYLSDSSYTTLGAWTTLELLPVSWLTVRGGGRVGLVGVRAPGDPESGSAGVRRDFGVVVGRVGVEARPHEALSLSINFDQGYRAPNLDDLTSRQQTGPGFQFENPDLRPERSTSIELGGRLRVGPFSLDAWGFATLLEDAMVRTVRSSEDCPAMTPRCAASRTQLQLVNVEGLGTIFGAEGGATLELPEGLAFRATVSFAWAEGPDPGLGSDRVPLSRVPPLHGSFEARYRHLESGVYAGAILRWAADQTRLAPADIADARIPDGGTPGWATVDVRAGLRLSDDILLALVVENLFDVAYRIHGSSINAAGLGVMATLSARLWPG